MSGESNLIPQPHGGALSPGNPGNRGGGRPKNELRELCSEGMELGARRMIDALKADEGKGVMTPEQIARYTDVFGKYAIGTKHEIEQYVDEDGVKLFSVACDVAEEMGLDRVSFVTKVRAIATGKNPNE